MNKAFTKTKLFVTIEGRVLAAALKPINFVIERRNTHPILGMVKLEVAGPTLRLTGSAPDIEITTELDVVDAGGDWSICADARLLANIARVAALAPTRIELVKRVLAPAKKGEQSVTSSALQITVGDNIAYEIENILPLDSFPILAGTRGDLLERFGNGRLIEMLNKVAWCISTEETRYYLNGVSWQTGPMGRRFAATDGHRLSLCRYDPEPASGMGRIIPRKTVQLLQRYAAGTDVTIYSRYRDEVDNGTGIELVMDRTSIRSKLIEGTFPDIDRVMPKPGNQSHLFSLNSQETLTALDQVLVVASDRSGRAVRFYERDGRISVGTKNHDVGEASVKLGGQWPEGATDFGLNGRYIKELLNHCSGDVTLANSGAGAPMTVTDDDATMTRVIMPMRV